jgi:hypothetical protein
LLDLFQPFLAAALPHVGEERGAAALLLRAAVRPACALPNPGRRRSQAAAATARAGALPRPALLAPPPAGRPMAAVPVQARRAAGVSARAKQRSRPLSLFHRQVGPTGQEC